MIDSTDKKRSAAALVDLMATDAALREAVVDEFPALTRLGNAFQIRHHEVDRHAVEPHGLHLVTIPTYRCVIRGSSPMKVVS